MSQSDYDEKVRIAKRLLASRTSTLENPKIPPKKKEEAPADEIEEKPESLWDDKTFDEVIEDW